MKTYRAFRTLALSALLLSTFTTFYVAQLSTVFAQGTAFTYQGRLNDGPNPANGFFDITFSLWTDSSGTTQVGATLTNAVAVSGGLFTVALNFGAGVFDGNARWLEIGVKANGGGAFSPLTPRQPITATPYAVRAANAASASSVSAANITGTIPLAQLPATVITNGATGVNIAGTFNGDGSAVTGVNLLTVNSQGTILFTTNYGNFTLSSSPGVGSEPNAVTSADVNGDGWADLISVNFNVASLTVLTNNGSGGFGLSSSPGVGFYPVSVTSADVNGDGKPDLISTTWYTASLTVLTNDGSGGFVLSSSPGVGSGPNLVTSADVNGDAKVDLVSANMNDDTLTVLTNDGSGGFALSSSPGVGNYPTSVTAADVNGDGKVDLISANYDTNTLTVLTNDGSGGFGLSSSPGVGSGALSVTPADVNGDGQADLISANYDADTLTVLLNTAASYTAEFSGDGSGLTWMNASQLTSGTVPDERLSANVALRSGGNAFTGHQTVTGAVDISGNCSALSFIPTSDRNAKENFQPVSPEEMLAKVSSLPIQEWNFKKEAGTRHIGPMAQDFYAAFGIGPDDKHIATVDADGVALAAIQGLNQKVESENASLRAHLTTKDSQIAALQERLERLESLLLPPQNPQPNTP